MSRMNEQQKREYAAYRKECKLSGVIPTLDDFLGIERSWEELDARMLRAMRRRQKAA